MLLCLQAEISRTEIEAGINIVDVLNEKTGFLNRMGSKTCLTAANLFV
jgi:tyrosyl-tRNA synthetase